MLSKMKMLAVLIAFCTTSAYAQQNVDPVGELKPILKRMQEQGTQERVVDFTEPGAWVKRKAFAANLKYDVRKTESLVTPFIADVIWENKSAQTEEVKTEQEARKKQLPLPEISTFHGKPTLWHARFAYQEGKWVVQDIWWRLESDGKLLIEKRHSSGNQDGVFQATDKDPVQDWWIAVGGDVE